MPSGDIKEDMREIKLYFKDFKGKHPEKLCSWRTLTIGIKC